MASFAYLATNLSTSNCSIVRLVLMFRVQKTHLALHCKFPQHQQPEKQCQNSALLQAHVVLRQLCLVTSKQVLMLSDRVTKPGPCHGWDGSHKEDA